MVPKLSNIVANITHSGSILLGSPILRTATNANSLVTLTTRFFRLHGF